MAHAIDPTAYAASVMFKYVFAVQNGALLPDAAAHRATAEALALAGQASDDFAFEAAQLTRGLVLARSGAPQSAEGYELLNEVRKQSCGDSRRSKPCDSWTPSSQERRPGWATRRCR